MSASSGRDVILNGELQGNLDAKGFAINNADLSGSTTTPPNVPTIDKVTNALKGDGAGNAVDSKVTLTTPASAATLTLGSGKTVAISNSLTVTATDGATLAVGSGGTLGTAAYTAASAYATSAQGTKVDSAAAVTGLVKCNGSGTFSAGTAKTDFWDTSIFVAGGSHNKGLVPDPGAGGGTTKYLREDATWDVPPASSGVTIEVTALVLKGDGAGGGTHATSGNSTGDYVAPSTALGRLLAGTTALSGATPTANWNTTTSFSLTLSADATIAFSNVTDGWDITIAITNTASNYTVAWPAGIKWVGGTTPTQTVGAFTDVWGFKRVGSITYGAVIQNMS